ncbi:MAG: metallophosphoesterase family protein [Candidatus Thorarchaeota archaeon]
MEIVRSILDGNNEVSKDDIWQLSGLMQDHYRQSPNVLDLPTDKVIFVGDLHGELQCTQAVQKFIKKYDKHHFVFLGDYADRGPEQIETFNLVMALTLANPKRVIMLRGNHESDRIATKYGFYNVVTKAHSFDVFKHYSRVFEVLPIAVYKKSVLFACHGGVPEGVSSIKEIQSRNRRHPDFPDEVIVQVVWNDPKEKDYKFRPSTRGEHLRFFGKTAFTEFMNNIDAKIMFRAHQVFPDGCKTFFDGRLVSVFSSTYGTRVRPKIVRLCSDHNIEPLDLIEV